MEKAQGQDWKDSGEPGNLKERKDVKEKISGKRGLQ